MLREISAGQMDEWIAFYRIEPWGLAVLDLLFAHLKAIIANLLLPKGKTAHKAEDLRLWPEPVKPKIESDLYSDEDEWQQQA